MWDILVAVVEEKFQEELDKTLDNYSEICAMFRMKYEEFSHNMTWTRESDFERGWNTGFGYLITVLADVMLEQGIFFGAGASKTVEVDHQRPTKKGVTNLKVTVHPDLEQKPEKNPIEIKTSLGVDLVFSLLFGKENARSMFHTIDLWLRNKGGSGDWMDGLRYFSRNLANQSIRH